MNKTIIALAFLLLTNIHLNFSADIYDPKIATQCVELIAKDDKEQNIYLTNMLLIWFTMSELATEARDSGTSSKERGALIADYNEEYLKYYKALNPNYNLIMQKIQYNLTLQVLLYYILIENFTEQDLKDFDLKEDLEACFPKLIEGLNPKS